ncbi:ShlB/FhaC/HecB family hemolysin secretion/activation protein [Marinospirillum sp.]|uniref:ShlB/FhaC/HecB family hemolysin secretion/activation protein n=1 Tax=Marinospirillum sp. TaxID=2183934 RepID=UPI00286FF73D|nr:ShlB/FhaC/HecB family hemolysin secretion/activation protein [Marinospirillum sp.]MDR9467746.1 ShlB/FhaC/HecB family hemolysin secretion/activation protein [Marinospirillum sp.]
MIYKLNPITLALVLMAAPVTVIAQERPEAGQIQQQSQPRELAPLTPSVELDLDAGVLTAAEIGGARVQLNAIRLQGNQVFSAEKLLAQLGDYQGQQYDLAGLQGLANRISQFYRKQGYVFASALLPVQDLASGELVIHVIEGRYGQVNTRGDSELAAAAQRFVSPLQPGDVIESRLLERQLMIMGDLPGVAVVPVMRPGEQLGTGNLDVQVSETQRITGRVSADNHGSRFSGAYRARGDLQVNRLLTVGDELSVSALYTSEETWLGSLSYALPLMANGLRGSLSYSYTDYTLGKGFEGYTGTAGILATGLSYPLLRSQTSNLRLNGTLQYKDLDDAADISNYKKATESYSLPLALLFDHRDALGRGGVTWGSLSVTPGQMEISTSQTGSTVTDDESFLLVNLEVVRLQALSESFSLYGRFNSQWANHEQLDGSESFSIGGPSGVRAFPVGEGSDSRGWLTQFELRYQLGWGVSPYILLDAGRTLKGGTDETARELAAGGVGARYNHKGFSAGLVSAWELDGGDAQADSHQKDPRLWLNASYSF